MTFLARQPSLNSFLLSMQEEEPSRAGIAGTTEEHSSKARCELPSVDTHLCLNLRGRAYRLASDSSVPFPAADEDLVSVKVCLRLLPTQTTTRSVIVDELAQEFTCVLRRGSRNVRLRVHRHHRSDLDQRTWDHQRASPVTVGVL